MAAEVMAAEVMAAEAMAAEAVKVAVAAGRSRYPGPASTPAPVMATVVMVEYLRDQND